jgi:hypothetical protein
MPEPDRFSNELPPRTQIAAPNASLPNRASASTEALFLAAF